MRTWPFLAVLAFIALWAVGSPFVYAWRAFVLWQGCRFMERHLYQWEDENDSWC